MPETGAQSGSTSAALLGQIESRMAALSGLMEQIDSLRRTHESRAQALADREAALARRAEELQACAEEMAKAVATAQRHEQAATAEAQALRARLGELEHGASAAADSAVRGLHDMVGAIKRMDEAQALESRLAAVESESSALRASKAELESALAQVRDESTRLARERNDAAQRVEQLEAAIGELHGRLRESQSAMEAARVQVQASQSRNTEFESVITSLRERTEALEREADEAKASTSDLQNALNQAKERIDELQAEVRSARRGAVELETALRELQQRYDQAVAQAQSGEGRSSELAAALSEHQKRREEAEARIAELQREIDSLRDSLDGARKSAEIASATSSAQLQAVQQVMQRRRERLTRARRLLRDRSEDLARAARAVEARYRECEQILEAKEHVSAAARAIQVAEQRIRAQSARNKAGFLVAAALAGLAIIVGLSWFAAGQIVTPTILARMELTPEVRGRVLTPEQADGWRTYHESLLRDPLVTQAAAERLARRGITALGDAAQLRARLEADLRMETAPNHRLILELQGTGREYTRRVLETYAATLVSHANASRERRPDGAATVIAVEAAVVDEPIRDDRLMLAAGIGGVLTLIAGIGWIMAWTRLRKPASAEVEEIARHVEAVTMR